MSSVGQAILSGLRSPFMTLRAGRIADPVSWGGYVRFWAGYIRFGEKPKLLVCVEECSSYDSAPWSISDSGSDPLSGSPGCAILPKRDILRPRDPRRKSHGGNSELSGTVLGDAR